MQRLLVLGLGVGCLNLLFHFGFVTQSTADIMHNFVGIQRLVIFA